LSRKVPKEYLGAFKRGHRQPDKEFIDDELSLRLLKRALSGDEKAIKALEFLTRFNNEFHKAVLKKGDPNALHQADQARKECYARNNRRNRDALHVNNGLLSLEFVRYYEIITDDNETYLPLWEDG
jgi:hypothetical protein